MLPQRYVFSSKSQRVAAILNACIGCCCYHKGTYFQANHNSLSVLALQTAVVVATTKVRIFKQITTSMAINRVTLCCCCYHKGTYFQANHNDYDVIREYITVVVATTKVRIFKQITTPTHEHSLARELLLLPQRYVFSSKSQQHLLAVFLPIRCCCYHKGTYFQANHNVSLYIIRSDVLLLLPQRYVFSSKSQQKLIITLLFTGCCCYHKGTYFQANHNMM